MVAPPKTAVLLDVEGLASDSPIAAALIPILGRSPFQRHVKHLGGLGVGRIIVPLSGSAEGAALEEQCREQAPPVLPDGCELVFVRPGVEGRSDPSSDDDAVVLVAADTVLDPRLYRMVFGAAGPAWVGDRSEQSGDQGSGEVVAVGLRTVSGWRDGASHEFVGGLEERILVDELDAYLPDLRRTLRPYWVSARSADDRTRAAGRILDSAQKGVLDLPARYLHPPAENFLARLLSSTSLTPNHVTFITAITGFTATYLFATGSYGLGLVLALVTNVLDGVDGKLARIKLQTSPFGNALDHTLDVSFEFSWYVALGWGLSGGAVRSGPFGVALALIAVMIGTRGVSGVYKLITGRQIHDHRAFDRAVRLVAGRRNIYVMVLLAGFLVDRVGAAFTLSLWWALGTLGVYVARTMLAWATRRSGGATESV
ncbi:MAG: CDP-alcohol phosphatidyltransferase family protein [Longimicrobiales bacterium]